MAKKIYNIPLSCSFWDCLAKIYLKKCQSDHTELASILFMVPNRRSCQALISAFVRQQGIKPIILPQIIPIAEIDDDELFFHNFAQLESITKEKQAISTEDRLFLFVKLIMSKPSDFGLKQISLSQAINLAYELANLLDTACNMELSFDKLYELVPDKYAIHWQETLKLLQIITKFWPKILEEKNSIDLCQLKNLLLYKQADLWERENTDKTIVIAGITASFPSIVRMLRVVSNLPNGEIYFYGIDNYADERYWSAIDESHPQFELKELLSCLNISRKQIINIQDSIQPEREIFISEIMRPAVVSDAWQKISLPTDLLSATKGIGLIETHTQRDEAQAIALKMRETLDFPEKTAALITYDRNLARRVAAELKRFNIQIDDSAGIPLSSSPVGIFLRLLVEAAENTDSEVKLISFLKNPFTLFHLSATDFRKRVYDYETSIRSKLEIDEEDRLFFNSIKEKLLLLTHLLNSSDVCFKDILELHISLAEEFASSDETQGTDLLWRGDAGKTAANFINRIFNSSELLNSIPGKDYIPLFCTLMGYETVRSSYGTHPRLSILGPIEAKLCHFDCVILGEFNEGIWPKPDRADMWMSRPMKKDFGFSSPEKNIGILAADLCGFLATDNVILTRAERIDGTPMKKSRWLLRFETVLKALNSDIEALNLSNFTHFAEKIDTPSSYTFIEPPAPCPPVRARPRKLSASAVDMLVADPYSVFAKYILKLYPLDDLDIPMDQRDYGTLIHSIIEEFNNTYPQMLPPDAISILIEIGRKYFDKANISDELRAFWWPKFKNTASTFIAQDIRENLYHIYNEVKGEIEYNLPMGDFRFTAIADRIDLFNDGKINIIDYKTGKIPNKKQIQSGHALQLLLEGLIASKGHFSDIKADCICNLIYWHLGNSLSSKNILSLDPNENNLLIKCEEYLLKLVSSFDFETTPYHSRPIPKYVIKNRDYEHLARIKEWSVQDDEENNDG